MPIALASRERRLIFSAVNVLLVPLGSHGDVHPFVGIGLAMRQRGHRVRMLVNPYFGPLVEQAGLELVPLGAADDYTKLARNPDLWKSIKGSRIIFSSVGQFIRHAYDAILAHNISGNTVVVASSLSLGARVAEDRHQIPTATVHLQPVILRSSIDPPTLPGLFLGPRTPRWLMALQWAVLDNVIIDPLARPTLNAFRKEVGLAPVKGIFRGYCHSPRRVIGLWPDWYAPLQTDWPQQVRLSGFPLYDERGVSSLPLELQKFLAQGPAPIAFTFGSAMWHARELLEQSARACTLLGARGILLTRHRENLPPRLPVGVRHFDYAPFSELLPHCRALVHHGGIGTASQALAAGIPQIVLPHAHDQFDNATRLRRLGVARIISPKRYKSDLIAQTLGDLLDSAQVEANCKTIAARFKDHDGLAKTCDLIEELIP